MNPEERPLSYRLDKIAESLAQIENTVNTVAHVKSDLIAVAFVPGTDAAGVKQEVEADETVAVDLEFISNPEIELIVEDFTRLIKLDASKTESVLRAFSNKKKRVQWAGPVVALHKHSVAYLTHELIVQIDDTADVGRVLDKASELGYKRLRKLPYITPATYHLQAKQHPGRKLLGHARELMEIDGVVAEPNLGGTAEPDAAPGRELSSELWDRKKIHTEAAWQQLADKPGQDVVLAVVDGSLDKSHPSLPDYERKDFRNLAGDGTVYHLFTGSARGHGMRVAGVAAAAAEDDGVMGVAPGCSVLGLFYPATELDVLDMYLWAVGIDPKSRRSNFPPVPKRSADVIVTSLRFAVSRKLPMSPWSAKVFDLIAGKGRGDKGSLLFFSVGNSSMDTSIDNPWAAHENNFGVAASTLDAGQREVRAAYSNYRGVELCAPSSETLRSHPSGLKQGTMSLARKGRGNRNGTKSKAAQSAGNYTDAFGGTSSAAPLAAGVAALMLTARPELKHGEVREILRDSAEKIDPRAKDRIAAWREDEGQSWAFGFGRVDAKEAVRKAIAFDGSKSKKSATKKSGSSRPASLRDSLELASVCLILGIYHVFLFVILLWFWPCGDSKCLAWASLVLGLHHLVVWAVLKPLRKWLKDSPDDEDPAEAEGDPRG